MITTKPPHIPVLLGQIIDNLPQHMRTMIDGTLGAGGHSANLLERYPTLTLLGLDVDPTAIQLATSRLLPFGERAHIHHSSYEQMVTVAHQLGWTGVDGILLDLGVSSMQVDQAERGFAFMQDGQLDMRFNVDSDRPTAEEIVNTWTEEDLTEIFFRYGEERFSRRIAQFIGEARPIYTTRQLAELVSDAIPKKFHERIHPATRVFQALRIAVNDELGVIERTLPQAISLLNEGGRLAVISFHSLEDRIVKHIFKEASTTVKSPPGMMLEEKTATVSLITRKPLIADDEEISQNPRSRSAKLRVVEKISS
jgi:16S rRNA (cytosine1402-N4)-methyltransferase